MDKTILGQCEVEIQPVSGAPFKIAVDVDADIGNVKTIVESMKGILHAQQLLFLSDSQEPLKNHWKLNNLFTGHADGAWMLYMVIKINSGEVDCC
jgi:hypothetical protein